MTEPSRRRTALVTGASRGIGRAIAERLATADFELTISARAEGPLAQTANALRSSGARVDAVVADMGSREQIDALADAHLAQHDRLDVLVLSAGIRASGEFVSYPLKRLDTMLQVNLVGPFILAQKLLPALRLAASASPSFGAKIIAIASITGVVSEPALEGYGASKAALISLCESITASEGERGVSATALSPGYVDTDMSAWVHDQVDPQTMIKTGDIAELAMAVCRLSPRAAVPNIVVSRTGGQLWRA
jgi:3-oxoacyl-[acyl-carrier protein] reductase